MENGLVNYYWGKVWALWNDRGDPAALSEILAYLEKIAIYSSDASTRMEAQRTSSLLRSYQKEVEDQSSLPDKENARTFEKTPKQAKKSLKNQLDEDEFEDNKEPFLAVEKPKDNFDHVAGLENTKAELRKALEWPLRFNDLMKEYGLEPSKGILMFGPPGCGKTHIARCCAGEFQTNFVLANPSNIGSKWFGEAEKNVARCFDAARSNSPCILFIDEVDKLLRYESGSSVTPRVMAEFQIQMDGFEKSQKQIVILMGTNEPWRLAPALVRRGRIDRVIYIGSPDEKAIAEVFRLNLNHAPVESNIDFDKLASMAKQREDGFHLSCSDITEICRTAKEEALAESISTGAKIPIQLKHINSALDKVPPSISSKDLEKYHKWASSHASLTD